MRLFIISILLGSMVFAETFTLRYLEDKLGEATYQNYQNGKRLYIKKCSAFVMESKAREYPLFRHCGVKLLRISGFRTMLELG